MCVSSSFCSYRHGRMTILLRDFFPQLCDRCSVLCIGYMLPNDPSLLSWRCHSTAFNYRGIYFPQDFGEMLVTPFRIPVEDLCCHTVTGICFYRDWWRQFLVHHHHHQNLIPSHQSEFGWKNYFNSSLKKRRKGKHPQNTAMTLEPDKKLQRMQGLCFFPTVFVC